jgi:hypothetical protein
MSVVQQMVQCLRAADKSRFRITSWKITESAAWSLAGELICMQARPKPLSEVVEMMKRGELHVLGGRIRVLA